MHEFLRGLLGPIGGDHEFAGDGFTRDYDLASPALEMACFAGGGSARQDEDDLEDLPEPPTTGNAEADAAMLRYRRSLDGVHSRNNRQLASLRSRTKTAEEQAAKAPAEGSVVLSAEDAKLWEAYKALGTPSDVQTKLGERETLSKTVEESRKRDHLNAVAQAAGFKPSILAKYHGDAEYELRDVTETKDGKQITTKAAFIKDGDVFKPLADYAKTAWADELPALQATGTGSQGGATGGGVFMPAQPSGGSTNAGDAVSAFLDRRNDSAAKQINPFGPPAQPGVATA